MAFGLTWVVGLDQIGGTLPSFDELIYGRFLRPVNEFFRLVFVVTFFSLFGGGCGGESEWGWGDGGG